jgi:hypothetical protein
MNTSQKGKAANNVGKISHPLLLLLLLLLEPL